MTGGIPQWAQMTTEEEQGTQPGRWLELRDDRGKLFARLERGTLRLEVRRNGLTVVFDLRELMDAPDRDSLLIP